MAYTLRHTNSKARGSGKTKKAFVLSGVVLGATIIAGGVFTYLSWGKEDGSTIHRTASSEVKGELPSNSASSASLEVEDISNKDTESHPTVILIEPSGTFASNHSPSLSGSTAPSQVQSVCNTTPGATCEIRFTKDGITKSLTAQVTDSGGAAYWDWTLQELGLTEGVWKIEAVASFGNDTKTVQDALPMEVKP